MPLPSPNWSRPLPRPLIIPEVMKLVILADVRELIERHLPAHCRDKASWRVVARDLRAAALGADPIEVSVALRMALSLEIDGDLRVLPPTAASHVYRIVQEGLTNINKHAHAGQARVALGFGQDAGEHTTAQRRWLALTIEDDGGRAAENGVRAEGSGLGLIGIRERVMALGGTLDVIDLGDKGFKLHAMIPFEAPAEPPP